MSDDDDTTVKPHAAIQSPKSWWQRLWDWLRGK